MTDGPPRRPWLRPLKLLVSAALLIALGRVVDGAKVAAVLRSADPVGLAIVPCVWLAGAAVGGLRWRLVLAASGVRYRLQRCVEAYMVGAIYALFLPGPVGFDAARVTLVVRDVGADPGLATGTVVLERVGGALGLVVFLLGVSLVSPSTITTLLDGGSPAALQGAAAGALLGGPLLLFAARRWLPRDLPFVRSVLSVLDGLSPSVAAGVLGLSLLFQVVRFGAITLLAAALGIDIGVTTVLAVFPLVLLASMLPISLGGIGVREASAVALLAPFGVDAGPAVLLGFSIYANQALQAVIGGLVQLRRSAA